MYKKRSRKKLLSLTQVIVEFGGFFQSVSDGAVKTSRTVPFRVDGA
jgi:hypothetical protein